MANEAVIKSLREICENARTSPTGKFVGQQRIQARELDMESTFEARHGQMHMSEFLSNGCAVIADNSLDGKEWKWREFVPATVQSRATGGLGKMECGFDPQFLKMKMQKKVQMTERMYIHRSECMLNYIGSAFQGGQDGMPSYFNSRDNVLTVAEADRMMVDLMMWDMHSMAGTIDGTALLGNWAGDNRGSEVKPGRGIGNKYPHFDGIFKQSLLQYNSTYYSAIEVDLPAIADGKYFISWYGQIADVASSISELVAKINEFQMDVSGENPFSATNTSGNKIIVIANNPESDAYGDNSLMIYYSQDGTLNKCGDDIQATILQEKMAYVESPLCFKYAPITEGNFYDYFKDALKQIKNKKLDMWEGNYSDMPNIMGNEYIAIDPHVMTEWTWAKIEKLKAIFNADGYMDEVEKLFPRFVPMQKLKGTGLWSWSFQGNIGYLTNVENQALGVTKMWYSDDDDKVKSKNEMLGNVIVADHNYLATNAKGHPFESMLTAPYQPENLPHWAKANRKDAYQIEYMVDDLEARANISWTEGTSNVTKDVRLKDVSLTPQGDDVASVEWKIYFMSGNPATPADQDGDVTVAMTDAQFENITYVEHKVTLVSGKTETKLIPKGDIYEA